MMSENNPHGFMLFSKIEYTSSSYFPHDKPDEIILRHVVVRHPINRTIVYDRHEVVLIKKVKWFSTIEYIVANPQIREQAKLVAIQKSLQYGVKVTYK